MLKNRKNFKWDLKTNILYRFSSQKCQENLFRGQSMHKASFLAYAKQLSVLSTHSRYILPSTATKIYGKLMHSRQDFYAKETENKQGAHYSHSYFYWREFPYMDEVLFQQFWHAVGQFQGAMHFIFLSGIKQTPYSVNFSN